MTSLLWNVDVSLRRPSPELDTLLDATSQPASPVPAPKRHKLVPVYGLPVLAHCPKYGEFWRPKIIGQELVKLSDSASDSDVRRDDKLGDDDVAKAAPMTDEYVRMSKTDAYMNKFEDNRANVISKANEDVKFYKKNDAHRSSLVSEDTVTLTSEKIINSLRRYEDNTYKIMRGLRKIDEELVQALPSLCAESLATHRAPRVRVIPTYGQPLLVHCPRYGTFRRWKIVDHEIVRPGQQAEEEEKVPVPEDVGDGADVDERIFPENDEAYRRYKKFDTYDQPVTEDDNGADTEKADAASTVRQSSPVSEIIVPPPQVATVTAFDDEDDEDMGGLFGVYAREH